VCVFLFLVRLHRPSSRILTYIKFTASSKVSSSRPCNLLLRISGSTAFSFPYANLVAAYIFLVFPLLLSFLQSRVLEGISCVRCNQPGQTSIYCIKIFLPSLRNSSCFPKSAQLNFCIFLQHHVSKLYKHFSSGFRSV
jgi:hypothetical protein